MSEAHVYIAFN